MNEITPENAVEVAKIVLTEKSTPLIIPRDLVIALVARVEALEADTNAGVYADSVNRLQAQRDAAVAILREARQTTSPILNQVAIQALAALGVDAKEAVPSNE